MLKRPRRVPFHISFSLVSGLSSVFMALPCSTPWWLSGAEFPLLWCPKSPLIFLTISAAYFGLRGRSIQVAGRVSMWGWICVCSCALSQRKQSPGEMRLLVRSCSCCRCCHHDENDASRKTWLHHYWTGTRSTPWQDLDQYHNRDLDMITHDHVTDQLYRKQLIKNRTCILVILCTCCLYTTVKSKARTFHVLNFLCAQNLMLITNKTCNFLI